MMKAADFVKQVYIPLREGWGYIWGELGGVWTAQKQKRGTRENNKQTQAYGSKWIGKRVVDCSGLLKVAAAQLGVTLPHSSSAQHRLCSAFGDLKNGRRTDGKPIKPGTAVFEDHGPKNKPWNHVGVYVGGGITIEAKGTRWGVVASPLSRWPCWGELSCIDYSEEEGDMPTPTRDTIRRGATGDLVKEAQELLIETGYLGAGQADGVFGGRTLAAVRAFQASRGLTADGVVGPLTWAALDRAVAVMDEETYVATIRGLTEPQTRAVKNDWPNAVIERERDDSNA